MPHLSTPPHATAWKDRRWTSRLLHRVDEVSASPITGFIAFAMAIGWAAIGGIAGFPSWWTTMLYSVGASVTFVMVFVIQHAHARQMAATQRKLDELIRATAKADDGLIAVEEASDGHLQHLTESTVAEREWT